MFNALHVIEAKEWYSVMSQEDTLKLGYHLTGRAEYFISEMTAAWCHYNTQAVSIAGKHEDIDLDATAK